MYSLDVPEPLFLSTPSAMRATGGFNRKQIVQYISIHALRDEGDTGSLFARTPLLYFYPRPPR